MSHVPEYMQSLRKESVVQSVINRLTDAIRKGELKPGDKLAPEVELAESLEVARSSVREAIKILSYLGVLESKRAEGTFVCNGYSESMIDPMVYGILLNQDSFEKLVELREMTEAGMMRLAIKHHEESEVEELGQILEEMYIAAEDKEDPENLLFDADSRFHDKIAEMGKNPMADKISRIVRTLTYEMRRETVETMLKEDRAISLIDAHSELLEAIRDRNLNGLNEKVRRSYYSETKLLRGSNRESEVYVTAEALHMTNK